MQLCIFQAEKMFERFHPVFGCECKQLLTMQWLRRQQRHGAGDYFPDSLGSSAIWGFRYQALQSHYRALFVDWNEVLREVVHPTSCLASRLVESILILIVSGDKIPRGSKIVDTNLNIFLCVYSLAFRGNCSNVFIRKQSVLVFHF